MSDELDPRQEELCEQVRWDFSDLRALYVNCTLKRSPEASNTQGVADSRSRSCDASVSRSMCSARSIMRSPRAFIRT